MALHGNESPPGKKPIRLRTVALQNLQTVGRIYEACAPNADRGATMPSRRVVGDIADSPQQPTSAAVPSGRLQQRCWPRATVPRRASRRPHKLGKNLSAHPPAACRLVDPWCRALPRASSGPSLRRGQDGVIAAAASSPPPRAWTPICRRFSPRGGSAVPIISESARQATIVGRMNGRQAQAP